MHFHKSDCNFANLGSCILGKKLTCKPCFDYVKTIPNLDRSGHVTILLARKAGRHSFSSIGISFFSFVLALFAFLLSAGIISLPKQSDIDTLKANRLIEKPNQLLTDKYLIDSSTSAEMPKDDDLKLRISLADEFQSQ